MKYCISIFFSLCCLVTTGQGLQLKLQPINVDLMGTSVRLGIRKEHKKHVWELGLAYLINPPKSGRYPNAVYANKAFAENLSQRFVLTGSYERSVKFKNGNVRVFPFYEFGIAYTRLHYESYILMDPSKTNVFVAAYKGMYNDAKVLWLLNHVGLGCEFSILPKCSITQQVGLSPSIVIIYLENGIRDRKMDGFIVPFYAIGLNYHL